MLELSEPVDCTVRDLGEGAIRVLVWGSVSANPSCWVRLYATGQMRVVDQNDLIVHGNPGDPRDVPPRSQPFTREDVVNLRMYALNVSANTLGWTDHWAGNLAARIESMLPPDAKDKDT